MAQELEPTRGGTASSDGAEAGSPGDAELAADTTAPPLEHGQLPKVEVGWVLAGDISSVDREAIQHARDRMLERLRAWFPSFSWEMPMVMRKEALLKRPAEAVELLDVAVFERDAQSWDFVFVVTESELLAYERPFALAMPSVSLGAAVLSTARLDPETTLSDLPRAERLRLLTSRIEALALHLFGHLNDLSHSEVHADFMFDVRSVSDLDRMQELAADERSSVARHLDGVADLRLEERGSVRSRLKFYLRASIHDRREIFHAVMRMRPWLFPVRLSRLTTPAASTMVVMLITAEAWDLGMSQSPLSVTVLSLLALTLTSLFIIERQHLVRRLRATRLTEQRVVSNVSVLIAVGLGMFTTYALLFGTTLLAALTLFKSSVVTHWAESRQGGIGLLHYLELSGFVASLGISIGALGASFEEQTYFRHVAMVDEET